MFGVSGRCRRVTELVGGSKDACMDSCIVTGYGRLIEVRCRKGSKPRDFLKLREDGKTSRGEVLKTLAGVYGVLSIH